MRAAKLVKICSELKFYRDKRSKCCKAVLKLKNKTFASIEDFRRVRMLEKRIARYDNLIAKLEAKVI